MKKLCVISMLVLGIVGNALCQKVRSKHDTMTVLEGIRPPIMVNDFARKSDIYFNEEVKKNLNNLVIDFGNKNRLLIDYQGTNKFELKHNVDSLLRNFWQDYSLIRDTLRPNTVKKITYYAKNKNVNRKAMIDIQYFPQKEVFQFGKEVELVRLQQDTLVLVNFDDKASAELVKTANRVFKTYQNQSFLFNLNAIDDVEDILENNINQAIIEASERVENERKTVKPWKILGVVNDLSSQRIRSKVKGNALFDFISMHADVGVGLIDLKPTTSYTAAIELKSSSYLRKGILFGIQQGRKFQNQSISDKTEFTNLMFTGVTFYSKKGNMNNKLKSGLFIGYTSNYKFDYSTTSRPLPIIEKNHYLKFFAWYQITPLFRLQIDIADFEFKRVNSNFVTPTYRAKQTSFNMSPTFRLSLGF
ncbi:hypothetical protein GCM10027035_19960 [Emticicia sediminis]